MFSVWRKSRNMRAAFPHALSLPSFRKHTRGGAEKEPLRPGLQFQHLTAALRAGPGQRGSHQTSVPRPAGAGERPSERGRHHPVGQQGACQRSLLPGSAPPSVFSHTFFIFIFFNSILSYHIIQLATRDCPCLLNLFFLWLTGLVIGVSVIYQHQQII